MPWITGRCNTTSPPTRSAKRRGSISRSRPSRSPVTATAAGINKRVGRDSPAFVLAAGPWAGCHLSAGTRLTIFLGGAAAARTNHDFGRKNGGHRFATGSVDPLEEEARGQCPALTEGLSG